MKKVILAIESNTTQFTGKIYKGASFLPTVSKVLYKIRCNNVNQLNAFLPQSFVNYIWALKNAPGNIKKVSVNINHNDISIGYAYLKFSLNDSQNSANVGLAISLALITSSCLSRASISD